jgi:hypothetical protein
MDDLVTRSSSSSAVAPQDLIRDYCHPQDVGALADLVEVDGARTWQGFCGCRDVPHDSFVVDFLDGADFASFLTARGWRPPFRWQGSCPPYLVWSAEELPIVVASYERGQLTVTEFSTKAAYHDRLPMV